MNIAIIGHVSGEFILSCWELLSTNAAVAAPHGPRQLQEIKQFF